MTKKKHPEFHFLKEVKFVSINKKPFYSGVVTVGEKVYPAYISSTPVYHKTKLKRLS